MNLTEGYETFGLIIDVVDLILSIFSISLNLLVSHILVRRLGLTQTDTVVSFILCILDFIYSFYSIISIATLWSTSYHALIASDAYCQFNGAFIIAVASSTVDTVMILGLLRCLAICYNRNYSIKTYTIISTLFICLNIGLSITSFIHETFSIYPSLKYCGYKPHSYMANIILYITGTKEGICAVLIVFCYSRIAYHYYNYLKELRMDNNKFTSQFDPQQSIDQAKIATNSQLILDYKVVEKSVKTSVKKIYIIIAIYLIEFMVIIGVQTSYKSMEALPHPILDNILCLFLNCIPVTNPLFILFFHDETNHEMQAILALIGFKFSKKLNSNS